VVTLLTPLPLEPDPELEPEVELELESEPLEPEPLVVVVVLGVDATVVVVLGVDATVVADDAVEVLRASAGSCPETSTIAIINQVATNSATAPEITRRRILRVRAARSLRSAWPRARAASLLSVIRRVMGPASSRAVSPT
jgi:hypothetical protein